MCYFFLVSKEAFIFSIKLFNYRGSIIRLSDILDATLSFFLIYEWLICANFSDIITNYIYQETRQLSSYIKKKKLKIIKLFTVI